MGWGVPWQDLFAQAQLSNLSSYMDKCVQAKSGIQAPDVSLQRSGHRTGDRGKGVGRKEGESTNQQPLPACCRSFTFCLWVRSQGPLELSRDK